MVPPNPSLRPRPKAAQVSASPLFDAFNHPLAYSLGLHLWPPTPLSTTARNSRLSWRPPSPALLTQYDLHDLNEQARVFYGRHQPHHGALHTIPRSGTTLRGRGHLPFRSPLIKVIPPPYQVSLGPAITALGRTSPTRPLTLPRPNPRLLITSLLSRRGRLRPNQSRPAASSSRLIARVAAPTGSVLLTRLIWTPLLRMRLSTRRPRPLGCKPARVRALREKKKARIGSPEALPAKPKKGKKGKEKADS
ncbi:hypothetical protein DFH07DRAFT_786021, partial [Mycena maculata]